MLKPSSVVENDYSEDCSSGSESGSEVSLEPETDRFGFIVTTGSTAMCTGPHPQVVRQREAKWINIMEHWECISVKKTNKSLDTQPALQSWVDVIERDLDRQFPFHEMFLLKDGHGQRNLFRVLKAYTQYQPKEGYCQAQGPVAAVLLMNMPAEEAFWCLVQISDQYLPGYYSPLLEGVLFDADMLTWVLKRICPSAHKHLQHHGIEPLMFATDWLMCLFTRHLPFNILLRVWDLFFCHGVRVLLQVGVVLVRRVLGRAEQRKQCQGQMETLERLRCVKNEVQDEDDAFIAEVCSVPLSASDLEKQTEKALEKWRKDRPLSTFDPRGRCQGYQVLWARAKHNKEERYVKEREEGNLSVPLARSASVLSLSPSRIHWRWRKGEKVKMREWDSGRRVMRHLSFGAKDEWKSWNDLNFKGVQCVREEDTAPKELKKRNNLTGQNRVEEKEALEENQMFKGPNILMHHAEITEHDGSQKTEAKMTEVIDNSAEDRTVKTESSQSPAEALVVENITEHMSHHKQEGLRQWRETVSINSQEKTEQQLAEGIQENQTDANTEVEVKMKEGVNTSCDVTDVKSERTGNVLLVEEDVTIETELPESSELIANTLEAQLQQNKSDVIAETEETTQRERLEADSSVEHDEESRIPEECDVLSQTEDNGERNKLDKTAADVETDAFPLKDDETLSQEGKQPKERKAAQPEAPPGGSEKEINTTAEGKQWSEGIIVTGGSEVQVDTPICDQTQVETPAGTQMDEETSQAARHPAARPDGKMCLVEVRGTEQRAQQQPGCQGTEGPEGEEVNDSISSEATDNHTGSMEEVQNTDECHIEKVQQRNSRQTQVSGRSSRPSAEVRSRLAQRLSEDVFVHPQRTNPSRDPGRLNPTDDTPAPPSAEQTSETPVPHKHFSLFRRRKGEQPKKIKTKGTSRMQVPKIVIEDFSDKLVQQEEEVSLKEERRTRRERERKEKEEETLRKKREKELKKEREQDRKKPQRKDRSFFGQRGKDRGVVPPSADTQTIRLPAPYAESYF